jgi:hypothetical protein
MAAVQDSSGAQPYLPGSPTASTPLPGGRRVSPAGYWISAVIFVVGIGAAGVWLVVSVLPALQGPDDFDRLGVPDRTELDLDTGTWIVYREDVGSRRSSADPEVSITNPDGRRVPTGRPRTNDEYRTPSGNEGVGILLFEVDEPGRHTVTVSGEPDPDVRIAIGRSIVDLVSVEGLLGSLALGAVAFVAGLVVLVVTLVRRGRAKRERLAALGGGMGAPPGPSTGPPPPGPAPGPPLPGPAPGPPPDRRPPPAPPLGGRPPTGPSPGMRPPPGSSPWDTPGGR